MEWNQILSAVLQSLLEFLLPILAVTVVGAFVSLLKLKWAEFKALNPSATALLEQAAIVAVTAAEQAGLSGLIKDKREYAFEIAEAWLKKNGITIDTDLIYAAIEAAVWKEFNSNNHDAIGFSGIAE